VVASDVGHLDGDGAGQWPVGVAASGLAGQNGDAVADAQLATVGAVGVVHDVGPFRCSDD